MQHYLILCLISIANNWELKTIKLYYDKSIYDFKVMYEKEKEKAELRFEQDQIIMKKLQEEFELDDWFEEQEEKRKNFY